MAHDDRMSASAIFVITGLECGLTYAAPGQLGSSDFQMPPPTTKTPKFLDTNHNMSIGKNRRLAIQLAKWSQSNAESRRFYSVDYEKRDSV